jgi:hypothetical protein
MEVGSGFPGVASFVRPALPHVLFPRGRAEILRLRCEIWRQSLLSSVLVS